MKKEILATGKFISLIKQNGYEMVERINCTGVVLIIAVHVVALKNIAHWLENMQRSERYIDPKVYSALYLLGD